MAGRSTTFTFFGVDKFSRTADQVQRKAGTMDGKLGKFGKVGKMAGLAVAGGIGMAAAAAGAAVVAIGSMAQGAIEDEKAQARLAKGLKNSAGATRDQISAVESWISRVGEAKGIADDDLRPALGRLARSTGDVGEAQSLAGVAMDISAGTGKSLTTVADALAKAHDGNVGALARLGVKTKDASGKTLEFDEVLKNAARTFKGQAATSADTLEGKVGRLKLMFSEAKESVGAAFLPILTKVADFILAKAVPAIRSLAEKLLPRMREAWETISGALKDNEGGFRTIAVVVKAVAGFIATKLAPILIKLNAVYLKALITAIGKFGEYLPKIGAFFLRFAATGVKGFRLLVTAALATFGGILRAAEKGLGWIPGIGPKIKGAREAFDRFKDKTVSNLQRVEDKLNAGARKLDNYGVKARAVKEAKLKANIADLESKVEKAKRKLSDPKLTAEKKAKLKANIADLEAKVDKAKRELSSVKNRDVTITARIAMSGTYRVPGSGTYDARTGKKISNSWAGGGLIRGPGTSTSDSINAFLSNGEYVVQASAVRKYGVNFLDAINSGGSGASGAAPAPSLSTAATGATMMQPIVLTLDGRVVAKSLVELKRATGRDPLAVA